MADLVARQARYYGSAPQVLEEEEAEDLDAFESWTPLQSDRSLALLLDGLHGRRRG